MQNSKGIATILVMAGIFVFSVAAGYVSVKYFGADNPIEEELEEVAEDEAEAITKAPKGSLKGEVDALFPHKTPKQMTE